MSGYLFMFRRLSAMASEGMRIGSSTELFNTFSVSYMCELYVVSYMYWSGDRLRDRTSRLLSFESQS